MQNDFYAAPVAAAHAEGFADIWDGAADWLACCARDSGADPFVVDLGCGDGRMLAMLRDRGIPGSGVDQSPDLVARAQARGLPVARGEAAQADLPRASLITALGEVLAYETRTSGPALQPVIPKAAGTLVPGGVLVFDLPGPDTPEKAGWREGPGWLVASKTNVTGRQLTREITAFHLGGKSWQRSSEIHRQRLWQRAEVTDLLENAGFDVEQVNSFGDARLLPGRLGFVARKPPAPSRR